MCATLDKIISWCLHENTIFTQKKLNLIQLFCVPHAPNSNISSPLNNNQKRLIIVLRLEMVRRWSGDGPEMGVVGGTDQCCRVYQLHVIVTTVTAIVFLYFFFFFLLQGNGRFGAWMHKTLFMTFTHVVCICFIYAFCVFILCGSRH